MSDAKILCVETSADVCSVAVNCNGEVLELCELAPHKHSQIILPMIQKLLKEAGFSLSELSAIAFACGPGSFTGIRLAASVAQGLALGLGLPVIPVSTLNIMAQEVYAKNKSSFLTAKVLLVLDAKMEEVYLGAYSFDSATDLMQPLIPDSLVKVEQMLEHEDLLSSQWIGVGNGWKVYKDMLLRTYKVTKFELDIFPHARYLLPIAMCKFNQGQVMKADLALPVYLYEQVVKK